MKKKSLLLAVLCCLLFTSGKAQSPDTESLSLNPNPEGSASTSKKGTFFISPYYEFTRFQKLELIEQTNYHTMPNNNTSDVYLQDDLDDYNNNYGTEYQSGMSGLKLGYQLKNGIGLTVYSGLTHFNFKTWVSDNGSEHLGTQYPAVSFGGGVDYHKTIRGKLSALTLLTVNYCHTGTPSISSKTGEYVLSSNLGSMFWELDLAFVYPLGKFLPYVGGGYTQQFVRSMYTVQVLATDEEGTEFYNTTEFDSKFRGSSFYGFAGIEYRIYKVASVYLKSSFPNPLRSTLGFRIIL